MIRSVIKKGLIYEKFEGVSLVDPPSDSFVLSSFVLFDVEKKKEELIKSVFSFVGGVFFSMTLDVILCPCQNIFQSLCESKVCILARKRKLLVILDGRI